MAESVEQPLAVSAMAGKRLGLDIGGTNLRLGVFAGLTLLEESRFQANYAAICQAQPPAQAWQTILEITAGAIQSMRDKHPELQSVGIGFPGFIHPHTGVLASSPNLPGLQQVNLGADLSRHLGMNVGVYNDANAAAYGEYAVLGQRSGGLLYIGLGTGVGGGLVMDGQLWTGAHGCALEVGHVIVEPGGHLCGCGNRGCVEQYASATAISKAYAEQTAQTLTAQAVYTRATQGDGIAQAVYHAAGQKLGQGLAMVLNIVDVEHVVIGGGMVAGWSQLQAAFMARLQHDLIPVLRNKVQIHLSTTGDVAGMLGAALLAGQLS